MILPLVLCLRLAWRDLADDSRMNQLRSKRIAQINKFYYPFGGVETYLLALSRLLERHGLSVIPFATQHPWNWETPWQSFFVSSVDYRTAKGMQRLRAAARVLFSIEAYRKVSRLCMVAQPDLAHVHHVYHQLSASVLYALARAGVPIVQTVHDYKLVCPNYKLYIPQRREVCYRCRGGRFYQATRYGCLNHGRAASLLATIEAYLNQLLKPYHRLVKHFITPSVFLRERLLEGGIPPERISVIYNFVDEEDFVPPREGRYVLFVGRLEPEKGVDVLIDAVRQLSRVTLLIAGRGSAEAVLRRQAEACGSTVRFVGWLDPASRRVLFAESLCVVVPSLWYDVAPMVILEAYAAGKPVIGSARGGIPELVRDGETGFIVSAGDSEALAERIHFFQQHPEQAAQMGRYAQIYARQRFSAEEHYQALMAIYQRAMDNN